MVPRSAKHLVLFAACLAAVGWLAPVEAAAQGRALFSDDDLDSRISARATGPDPMVLRARLATVDLTMLAASGVNAAAGSSEGRLAARSLDLNLFANADFVAHLDRVEVVPPIGYAWVGHIA